MHVGLTVDKVALGQVSLPVLQFSAATIIPPVLHTHIYLHVALTGEKKNKEAKPSNLPNSNGLSVNGEHWIENNFHFNF
jgi:hypothetical protein